MIDDIRRLVRALVRLWRFVRTTARFLAALALVVDDLRVHVASRLHRRRALGRGEAAEVAVPAAVAEVATPEG